jgi:putative ABC transport system permease protein
MSTSLRNVASALLGVRQDLRLGLRSLRRARASTLTIVATLALGIGASAAIFSFVDAVLLKPLPYEHAERIVRILERPPAGGTSWFSTPDYLDWRAASTVFEDVAAQQQGTATITGGAEPVPLRVLRVTASYFDVFGARAALGRTFVAGEDAPGNERVVVLSHALWQARFGGATDVVGKSVELDGVAHTVVGVLPERSAFGRTGVEIWQPLAFRPANLVRGYRWVNAAYARLAPGVTLDEARAQMDAIAARLAADYPDTNRGWGVAVDRYADAIVGARLATSLLALAGAVGGLLLICCANLASLALARAVARTGEVAVRAALGAGRWRLARQFLLENLAIAAVGGAAGTALAYAGVAWLKSSLPVGALPSEARVALDSRALAFALVLTVGTATLLGLVSMLRTRGADVASAIREGGRGTTSGRARRRLFEALIVGEIALATLLLAGSAVLARSFVGLLELDPGFDGNNVLTMALPAPGFPPGSRYASPDEFKAHVREIEAAIAALPGVRAVALTNALPLTDCCLYGLNMEIEGHPVADGASRGTGSFKVVTPSYFRALGLTLRRGRFLDEHDVAGATPAVVINERLAARYFGDEDPVGRHIVNPAIVPGKTERGADVSWEVVGVVANEKIGALDDDASAVLYATYEQSPAYFTNLMVRADVEAATLERSVRAAIAAVDPGQGIRDVRTLERIKSVSLVAERFQTLLSTLFAVVAVALAAAGIYGVLSYFVAQRSHELGVRAALGASAARLLQLVVRRAAALTLLGLAAGLGAAVAALPLLRSIVYHVDARDPFLLGAAAGILLLVALAACIAPALRAARVDPMSVLRGD